MQPRSLPLIALSLVLLAVWISGAHFHLSHHDHEAGEAGSGTQIVEEDEDAPDHIAAHLHHGDVDVEGIAKAIGKVSVLKLPVFCIAYAIAFVLPLPTLSVYSRQPPLRPPAWQSWPDLLPPSQAPPGAV